MADPRKLLGECDPYTSEELAKQETNYAWDVAGFLALLLGLLVLTWAGVPY